MHCILQGLIHWVFLSIDDVNLKQYFVNVLYQAPSQYKEKLNKIWKYWDGEIASGISRSPID